jgi:uncharacterized protein YndB with AHSA1/START domain
MKTAANGAGMPDPFAVIAEPATLRIERLLPGPVERVWRYLTESELRRQWLGSGAMELKAGAEFTVTWRNDTLTDPPGRRPEGFSVEHSQKSHIVELEPNRKLSFTWGAKEDGKVTMLLTPKGSDVLLTVIHERLPAAPARLHVCTGWHAHLDLLAARLRGEEPARPFWDGFTELLEEYRRRLPA